MARSLQSIAGSIAGDARHSLAFLNRPPVFSEPLSDNTWDMYSDSLLDMAALVYDPDGDPFTYAWTKISGPGTVTFYSPGSAAGEPSFSDPGSYVLRLTVTDSRGASAYDEATITVTATAATIKARLGSRLHWWWEVGVSSETLNSGNFAQLNDYGPAGYHLAQSTAGLQPEKTASGGPNGLDCMTYQDTSRRMLNSSVSLSSGRFVSSFVVAKGGTLALNLYTWLIQSSSLQPVTELFAPTTAPTKWRVTSVNSSGTTETVDLTSPAPDTSWHVWEHKYAAAVVPVITVDGAATAPAFSTTSGGTHTIEVGRVGGPGTNQSTGAFLSWQLIENCSDASPGAGLMSERAAMRDYIHRRTALPT